MTSPTKGDKYAHIDASVGERLTRLREAAGLTQRDIAIKLGLNRSSVANMETGRQQLTLQNLLILGEVYNVPIGAIAGTEPMPDLPTKPSVTVESSHVVRCSICGVIGTFGKQIDANRLRDEHRKPHPPAALDQPEEES